VYQGDIGFLRVAGPPATAVTQAPEGGRLILARGEATGHHHSVSAATATMSLDEGGTTYLTVAELTAVEHEEHAPVALEPGIYQVVRQREATDADETWAFVGD
jgi:hypothetical protein